MFKQLIPYFLFALLTVILIITSYLKVPFYSYFYTSNMSLAATPITHKELIEYVRLESPTKTLPLQGQS